MTRPLVVKLTVGADAPERASQGLTVAATAVGAGAPVSLWLTGEAAWFAVPGRAGAVALEHAASFADLLDAVIAGGRVTLCTQCAERRGITSADVIPGIRIAGSATLVEELLAADSTPVALVY